MSPSGTLEAAALLTAYRVLLPYHQSRLGALATAFAPQRVVGLALADGARGADWRVGDDTLGFQRLTIPSRGIRSWQAVIAMLNAVNPSALAVPGWSDPLALAALAWGRLRGVPVVIMADSSAGDATRHRGREWLKRRVVALADAALVAGRPHRDYLVQLGMAPPRVCMGYDVVDNGHFAAGAAAARADADRLRRAFGLPARFFLTCARFVPKKDLPLLLSAFARYQAWAGADAWDLVVLGDGPLRGLLEAQVEALGLRESTQLRGMQSYEVLPVFYGLASAFVHASRMDQWGLVVNEAMAAALPVLVSSGCGCAVDLVRDGENGWVFPAGDEAALASCLVRMASAKTDRAAMGAASTTLIADWGLDRHVSGMQQALALARQHVMRRSRWAVWLQWPFLRMLALRRHTPL